MGKVAFVFPGQGAQFPGMGKSLYMASPAAKNLFDRAEKIRPGTMRQCFEGPAEALCATVNTQPCLFVVDMAAAAALVEAGVFPKAVIGFSLGEVAALCFAGAFSFEDGFRLVMERARLMQECAEKHPGAMLAVLRVDEKALINLCAAYEGVYPVNFNCPGQIVVSLPENLVDEFSGKVKALSGRAMRLKVGGAFHTPHLLPATRDFAKALALVDIKTPLIPVYANKTALPYAENLIETLSRQISSPVRFDQSVRNLQADCGIDTFIETGAGKVLSGLIQKISADFKTLRVNEAEDIPKVLSEVD